MKILFTGGGTGGHFYPIIAIIQELRKVVEEENIVGLKIYYMAPEPSDKELLFENEVIFKQVPAGKRREYFSILNYTDLIKTFFGVLKAIWQVFLIYPDVVVGKGGFGSVPALFAARLFKIPVVIHESDTRPGKTNEWASKFATRIAVSYPEVKDFFPAKAQDKVAYTGQPIRRAIIHSAKEGAAEYLNLEEGVPTVLVLGGSQGAKLINEVILEALPRLVENFQVIHQVGSKNMVEVRETAKVILEKNKFAHRYKPFEFLNDLAMRMSAGISDVVLTRAGSTLFEIAAWSKPAIIVPITESRNNHQRENAYAYARSGGAVIIEELNLNPSILISEIERIAGDKELGPKMGEAAHKQMFLEDSARKIATEALRIALSHL